mmetsp:Transcript_44181/g.127598  ORF Transcript_44181/g.127598 Transcript_44181/m.127598 type:complete len:251 (-) Transcript_44181:418-1170(-)
MGQDALRLTDESRGEATGDGAVIGDLAHQLEVELAGLPDRHGIPLALREVGRAIDVERSRAREDHALLEDQPVRMDLLQLPFADDVGEHTPQLHQLLLRDGRAPEGSGPPCWVDAVPQPLALQAQFEVLHRLAFGEHHPECVGRLDIAIRLHGRLVDQPHVLGHSPLQPVGGDALLQQPHQRLHAAAAGANDDELGVGAGDRGQLPGRHHQRACGHVEGECAGGLCRAAERGPYDLPTDLYGADDIGVDD